MAVTVEQVETLLTLRDEMAGPLKAAEGRFKALRGTVLAAGAALTGIAAKAGQDWADATRTIADGTGATGDALARLQDDFQAVAGATSASAADTAAAIADLNTHTGKSGEELRALATAALKAGADTNTFGATIRAFNVAAADQTGLLDELVVLGQAYGADLDRLQRDAGRYKNKMDELGLSMHEQLTLAALAQSENRELESILVDLREGTGNWAEKIAGANEVLADAEGAVERTYEAGRTWRDTLAELKDALLAQIGPIGDVGAAAGGAATAMATAGPVMVKAMRAVAGGIRAAFASNPMGLLLLAITAVGAAAWTFRDEIAAAFGAVLRFVQPWADRVLTTLQTMAGAVDRVVGSNLAGTLQTARDGLADLSAESAAWGEATETATDTASAADPVVASLNDRIADLEARLAAARESTNTTTEAVQRFATSFGGADGVLHLIDAATQAFDDQAPTMAELRDRYAAIRTEMGRAKARYRDLLQQYRDLEGAAGDNEEALRDLEAALLDAQRDLRDATRRVVEMDRAFGGLDGRLKSTAITFQLSLGQMPRVAGDAAGQVGDTLEHGGMNAAQRFGHRLRDALPGPVADAAQAAGNAFETTLEATGSFRQAGLAAAGAFVDSVIDSTLGAIPVIGPFLAGLAKALKNLVSAGTDWVQVGKTMWAQVMKGFVTSASPEQLEEAIQATIRNPEWGPTPDQATAWIVLRDNVLAAGGSIEQAEALWQDWVDAQDKGPIAVARVRLEMDRWADAAAEVKRKQEEAAEAARRMTQAVISSYRSITDEADRSAEAAREQALEEGASQAEAAAAAVVAWQKTYDEKKVLRIEEMAQEAAFAAALKAIQEGKSWRAIYEARRAYAETKKAATEAFAAVELASSTAEQAATEDLEQLNENAKIEFDTFKKKGEGTFKEVEIAAVEATDGIQTAAAITQDAVTGATDTIKTAAEEDLVKVADAADRQFEAVERAADTAADGVTETWREARDAINRATAGIDRNVEITVTQRHRIIHPDSSSPDSSSGDEGGAPDYGGERAAGGPVRRGMAYVVGERGPEVFVPQHAGAIVPNGGVGAPGAGAGVLPTADEIGAAVAAALRREPPTVAIDGRRIADATIRHLPRRSARTV